MEKSEGNRARPRSAARCKDANDAVGMQTIVVELDDTWE